MLLVSDLKCSLRIDRINMLFKEAGSVRTGFFAIKTREKQRKSEKCGKMVEDNANSLFYDPER